MAIEIPDEGSPRVAVWRIGLGVAGALAAMLIVLAIVRPDMLMQAMHDMMSMVGVESK